MAHVKLDEIRGKYEVSSIPEKFDIDPLHCPAMYSEWEKDAEGNKTDILCVYGDDGNESSYGHDLWKFVRSEFDPTEISWVELVDSYGRDYFNNNLSDQIHPGVELGKGSKLYLEEFNRALESYHAAWTIRSLEHILEINTELYLPYERV